MLPLYKSWLTISEGKICDENGEYSHISSPRPRPQEMDDCTDWGPFRSCLQFEIADILFQRAQMLGGHIDKILQLCVASLLEIDPNVSEPFRNHWDLYDTIDRSIFADNPWMSFSLTYGGKLPETGPIPT